MAEARFTDRTSGGGPPDPNVTKEKQKHDPQTHIKEMNLGATSESIPPLRKRKRNRKAISHQDEDEELKSVCGSRINLGIRASRNHSTSARDHAQNPDDSRKELGGGRTKTPLT